MPDDLPIYSDTPLRTGQQFVDLERLKGGDMDPIWRKSDEIIGGMESAADVGSARKTLLEVSRESLMRLHGTLFAHLRGAGHLRTAEKRPLYRGQDCVPPQFIERSLDNMSGWVSADSFQQIHPIEQCALAIARVVDIWPFEFGNLTVAVVVGNSRLWKAQLGPFFVQPEHRSEFEKAISQSMTIDMQPLVNAIYRTVKREMEAIAAQR